MIHKILVKVVLLFNLLVFAGPAHIAAAENQRILVVGDSISAAYGMSISEGWVALLQERLEQQGYEFEVINASISGDTSASGNQRISALLQRHQPSWVIIELGGNDGLRGLPIVSLRVNLSAMIDQSQRAGAQVLLAGMQIFPNYGPRYTQAFKQIYIDLAAEYKVHFVPFILEGVGGQEELIQADGIHPTQEAQAIILENVWRVLGDLL